MGTHDQVRQAEVTRNNQVQTLLDMERNVIGGHVGSAIAKLIHVAMRQQQAAWWLCHGRGKHTVGSCSLSWLGGCVRPAGWIRSCCQMLCRRSTGFGIGWSVGGRI
jgi:hypothetical protein